MIDYIRPMAGNTACVITSESHSAENLAIIKFLIVRTCCDTCGAALFDYNVYIRADNYTAWNETVRILERVARRVASYKETHPNGLGYLDRAYIYIDDEKPELDKFRI